MHYWVVVVQKAALKIIYFPNFSENLSATIFNTQISLTHSDKYHFAVLQLLDRIHSREVRNFFRSTLFAETLKHTNKDYETFKRQIVVIVIVIKKMIDFGYSSTKNQCKYVILIFKTKAISGYKMSKRKFTYFLIKKIFISKC